MEIECCVVDGKEIGNMGTRYIIDVRNPEDRIEMFRNGAETLLSNYRICFRKFDRTKNHSMQNNDPFESYSLLWIIKCLVDEGYIEYEKNC